MRRDVAKADRLDQGTATGYDPNTLICAECAFNSANANFIASSSTCPARSMKNPYSHFA